MRFSTLSLGSRLTRIAGGLFSMMFNSNKAVGASVSLFGLYAAYIGYIIVNSDYIDRRVGPCNKYMSIVYVSMFIFITLFSGMFDNSIDNLGHLGGLIFGCLFIFSLIDPIDGSEMNVYLKYVTIGLTWTLFALFVIIDFFVKSYSK